MEWWAGLSTGWLLGKRPLYQESTFSFHSVQVDKIPKHLLYPVPCTGDHEENAPRTA